MRTTETNQLITSILQTVLIMAAELVNDLSVKHGQMSNELSQTTIQALHIILHDDY